MEENITMNENVETDVETIENDNLGVVLAVVAGIAAAITGTVLLRKKFKKVKDVDETVVTGEVVND